MNKNKKPIIGIIDLETSPWGALCYGTTYEPVVVKINFFETILSMAHRIYGEKTCHYVAQNKLKGYKKGIVNDRDLMIEISKIINEYDYIVGHNLDAFDIKMIKERILFHRLPPIKDVICLDTKKLMKSMTKLPNNKLDTLTQFLGNGGKLKHNGTDLFIGCMNGDEESWRVNEKYNKQDVNITYRDLQDLLPYVKLTNPQTVFSEDIQCSNPLCLSKNLVKEKLRRVVGGFKQQYSCKDCHHYTQGKQLIKFDK